MKKKAPSRPRPTRPDCPKPRPKGNNLAMADAFFGIFGLKRIKTKPRTK